MTPNALYWYFRQKDQLLDALAEHIFIAVALPEPDDREWFVQLRGLLVAFVDALRPHLAVAGLTQTRILLSEPGINIAERALALLRGAGFSAEQAAQLGGFLLNAVVSLVIAEPGSHDVLDEDARDKERRARKAALLTLPPSEYPNVIDSADELTVCENDDAYYAQGIDCWWREYAGSARDSTHWNTSDPSRRRYSRGARALRAPEHLPRSSRTRAG